MVALNVSEIITLAFQGITDTNDTIAFDKTIPATVTGLERDLQIAEFAFPKMLALIRQIIAAAKS